MEQVQICRPLPAVIASPASMVPFEDASTSRIIQNKRKDHSFSQHYIKEQSTDSGYISLDHCYSKNWNSQSDLSYAQTAKFVSWSDNHKSSQPIPLCSQEEETIDVESYAEVKESQFDANKALTLMTECERVVKKVRPHTSFSSDDPINRSGWSLAQNKIFNRIYKTLVSARLARLANATSANESVQRRIYADKSSKRLRQVFSNACWDEQLLSWLHSACMDSLPSAMLSDYLEALQTLRAKVPSLIDKMIKSSDYHERVSPQCNEAMDLLLKRPWDPVMAMPSRAKLEKLPKNPILIIVPQIPLYNDNFSTIKNRRTKHWNAQLSFLGKVIVVPAPNIAKSTGKWECFDAMVGAVRTSIAEAKELYPNKPVILMGWNFGALLSIYVGSMEKVSAVVAMGYPIIGLNGLRGDADDVIMDSITPTLFVVGEHAQSCPIADLENMREKMRAENHLIVVSGANDKLNINFKTKKERNLTQNIVDRCMQDEIRSYLEKILTTPSNLLVPSASLPASINRIKKKKVKSQSFNALVGNKVITSIKSPDGISNVPKKRKSPLKDGKSRKQMKLVNTAALPTMLTEREQLAAISAITPGTNTKDPLNLSSSSQGSLTALKPQSLTLPHLGTATDSMHGTRLPVKMEPSEVKPSSRHARIYPAQPGMRKDISKSPAPTYIQLCGSQTGQSFAISMEKAKELLNMGLLRSVDRSKIVEDGNSFETTRQLLALPPGTTIGFTGTVENAVPKRVSSVIVSPESGGAGRNHIRNLLSDGRLPGKESKEQPAAASPTVVDKFPPIVRQPPLNLSPGQSLIRRLQTTYTTTRNSTITSRQLLVTSPQESSSTKSISVVVNTSRCVSTPATCKPGFTNLKAVSPLKKIEKPEPYQLKTPKPSEPLQSTSFNAIKSDQAPISSFSSTPLRAKTDGSAKHVENCLGSVNVSAIAMRTSKTTANLLSSSQHNFVNASTSALKLIGPNEVSEHSNLSYKKISERPLPDMEDSMELSLNASEIMRMSKMREGEVHSSDPLRENLVSPSASSTLSAQSSREFTENDLICNSDVPIILSSASMFNPEAEIDQESCNSSIADGPVEDTAPLTK